MMVSLDCQTITLPITRFNPRLSAFVRVLFLELKAHRGFWVGIGQASANKEPGHEVADEQQGEAIANEAQNAA